ncbi:hypothetical protein KW882_00530 [Vibrio parahaemolyticus]
MIFKDRPQYNQLMKLMSSAFKCQLSRTKVKFANAAGYKSPFDLEKLIPDPTKPEDKQLVPLDSLNDPYLMEEITFEIAKPIKVRAGGEKRINLISCTAPRIVKLLTEGEFTVAGTKWEKVFVESVGGSYQPEYAYNVNAKQASFTQKIELSISTNKAGEGFYLATLEQRVNHEFTVEDLSKCSKSMIHQLISSGNLNQYAKLCEEKELISSLGLELHLVARYFQELDWICDNFEPAQDDGNFGFMVYLDESELDEKSLFKSLACPPIEFVTSDVVNLLFGTDGICYRVFNEQLGLNRDGDIGFLEEELEGVEQAYLQGDKDYQYNEVQFAYLRHCQFLVEAAAKNLMGGSSCDGIVSDIIDVIGRVPLNFKTEIMKNLLAFIPSLEMGYRNDLLYNDALELEPLSEDGIDTNWYEIPFVAYLCIQVADSETPLVQYLFGSIPNNLLTIDFDLSVAVKPSKYSIKFFNAYDFLLWGVLKDKDSTK